MVLEQNVSFLTKSDYDKESDENKASGAVKLRDGDLWAKLQDNKEGIMLWALEGARRYVANRSLEPPSEMKAAKAKARDTTDIIGQWVRDTIINLKYFIPQPLNWEKQRVQFTDLQRILREENQGKSPFKNEQLKRTLEDNKFEVAGNTAKGTAYVKYATLKEEEYQYENPEFA
jgi:hypothetical protein